MLKKLLQDTKTFGGHKFSWPNLEKDSDARLVEILNEWHATAKLEIVGILDTTGDTLYRLNKHVSGKNIKNDKLDFCLGKKEVSLSLCYSPSEIIKVFKCDKLAIAEDEGGQITVIYNDTKVLVVNYATKGKLPGTRTNIKTLVPGSWMDEMLELQKNVMSAEFVTKAPMDERLNSFKNDVLTASSLDSNW